MKNIIILTTILILTLVIALVIPASAVTPACYDPPVTINNTIAISNILTQVQWMTQQQSQSQHQEQTVSVQPGVSSWIPEPQEETGIYQTSQTYSRLLYPGEVLPFEIRGGDICTLLSGLPVAFYVIDDGHGDNYNKVQTLEAMPSYDPVRHKMEFGYVPVLDKIDYWTMKAQITASKTGAYCVVDNRAPMNGYTTIEVVITRMEDLA